MQEENISVTFATPKDNLTSLWSAKSDSRPPGDHLARFATMMSTGHIPFKFRVRLADKSFETRYVSIAAAATSSEACQILASELFSSYMSNDDAVLSIDNIAIPMEAMNENFLSHVLLIHACSRMYVRIWCHFLQCCLKNIALPRMKIDAFCSLETGPSICPSSSMCRTGILSAC